MQERIEGLLMSMAGNGHCLQAPRTWIGLEVHIFCNLLDLVEQMNTRISNHIRRTSTTQNNAAAFTQVTTLAVGLVAQLRDIAYSF